jgi:L-asparaginase
MAGKVYGGADLRKLHSYRVEAFDSGDAGPVALLEEGVLRCFRPWPAAHGLGLGLLPAEGATWPLVHIVTSHAGADASLVEALLAAGHTQGIVVAGTGNGSLHHMLEAALQRAQAGGVVVLRASRCAVGGVVGGVIGGVVGEGTSTLPSAGTLTVPQARIELMLRLLLGAAQPR